MVSMLAFYSDNLSSNPADAYSFSVEFVFEKNENKQKEAGDGTFIKPFGTPKLTVLDPLPFWVLSKNQLNKSLYLFQIFVQAYLLSKSLL